MKDGIYNATITSTCLSTFDYGQLIFWVHVRHCGGDQGFGGFSQGATARLIRAVMEAAGTQDYAKLIGRAVRIKIKDDLIHAIGHIIEETKWFEPWIDLEGAQ